MSDARAVPGAAATRLMFRLGLRRHTRSKALWISLAMAVIPLLPVFFKAGDVPLDRWEGLMALTVALLAILPPMNSASVVAEELEDQTFSYLWSRPIPRWAVLTGKLCASAMITACVLGGVALLGYGLSKLGDTAFLLRGLAAIAAGVAVSSILSAALGTLVTKHSMAISIGYLLVVDIPLGGLPFALSNLSIKKHVVEISGVDSSGGSVVASAIWLVALAAFWLAIALWRTLRVEPRSAS